MKNMSNHQTEEEFEGERGYPIVALKGNAKIIGMILFLILGVLIIGTIIYNDILKAKLAPVTEIEKIEFRAPKTKGEPYIAQNVETPPQEYLEPAPTKSYDDNLSLQRERALRDEENRKAQKAADELRKRLRAPQIVYDSITRNNSQTNNGSQNNTAIYGNAKDKDPNIAFANSQSNKGVNTTKAIKLNNLETLIVQGEIISGVLETAIQSDLPGMVRAIVSENVYSFEGSNLLVPKGTRLVGQYRASVKKGQTRIFIIWNRLIRPDGASINIGSIGTDQLGRSGLGGDVDTHFMERFGASVLLSMIDGALSAAVNSVNNGSGSTVSLDGKDSFSKSSEIALENSIAIKPTIHIDQGTQIKILVGKDLDFSNVGGFLQ